MCCRKIKNYRVSLIFLKKALQYSWFNNLKDYEYRIYEQMGFDYFYLYLFEKSIYFNEKYIFINKKNNYLRSFKTINHENDIGFKKISYENLFRFKDKRPVKLNHLNGSFIKKFPSFPFSMKFDG